MSGPRCHPYLPDRSAATAHRAASTSGLKVPAPLPTQRLLDDPCGVLTDSELHGVGLASPGKVSQGPPPLCGWNSSDFAQNGANAGPVPQNKGGISDIYDQKAKQAHFQR
ncbi:DUF3558 domain-containing protein [Amycolatopsis sp. PS_44_ISF1]|nr:DUF3558 domain-containing protein [Amycolatopsis sp. PS_44_ISF1]